MVDVPTKAEFAALTLKVENLEAKIVWLEEMVQWLKNLVKTTYDQFYPVT